MISAENVYSRSVVADVMTAKRHLVQVGIVSKQVVREHGRHILGFPDLQIMDSADASVHFTNSVALRDAMQAKLTYGDRLLNRIPKSAVKVYDQYLQAKDAIHRLSQDIAPVIPQGDVDMTSEEVKAFLVQGEPFKNFYQDAESALKKLGRKLFFAGLTMRGTAIHSKNKAYEPVGFGDFVTVMRQGLQEDHHIAEDETSPMTERVAVQFIEELAPLCGILPELSDQRTVATFMTTLGFFTQSTSQGREIWYREATPAAWLYDLWMKKMTAIETFKKARDEKSIPQAYFALARVEEIDNEADSIRSGVIAELKGQRPSYPKKYLQQIGSRMYRFHKVLSFPLDEEKAKPIK